MRGREAAAELAALGVQVDHDLGDEAVLAEDVVQQQPQAGDLVVVDADEDRAPLGHHLAHGLEPRPHHRHPGAVPVGARPGDLVAVGERVAGVVRRVEVHHVVPLARRPRAAAGRRGCRPRRTCSTAPRAHANGASRAARRGEARASPAIRHWAPGTVAIATVVTGARHSGSGLATSCGGDLHVAVRVERDDGARRAVAADRDHGAVDEVAALLAPARQPRATRLRQRRSPELLREGRDVRRGVQQRGRASRPARPPPVSEISGRTSAPVIGPGGRGCPGLAAVEDVDEPQPAVVASAAVATQGPEGASHEGRTCARRVAVPSRVEERLALAEHGQPVLDHEARAWRPAPGRRRSRRRAGRRRPCRGSRCARPRPPRSGRRSSAPSPRRRRPARPATAGESTERRTCPPRHHDPGREQRLLGDAARCRRRPWRA